MIAKPLYDLLKKGTYHWNESTEQAFLTLKKVMTMPPILALPNAKDEFIIETGACDDGIGVVLMQVSHSFAFYSNALGSHLAKLSMYENDMLE